MVNVLHTLVTLHRIGQKKLMNPTVLESVQVVTYFLMTVM